MTFHFANTLYIINQEIILTLNKDPRDSLNFVTREHLDCPIAIFFPSFRGSSKVFISLRLSKILRWCNRDRELISCKWCSSGARQGRFTHVSVPSAHDKEQQHQLVPRIGALKGWRCFSDSWEDTSIWFQTCWDVWLYPYSEEETLESLELCETFLPILCPAASETFPLISYQRSSPWVSADRAAFTAISSAACCVWD